MGRTILSSSNTRDAWLQINLAQSAREHILLPVLALALTLYILIDTRTRVLCERIKYNGNVILFFRAILDRPKNKNKGQVIQSYPGERFLRRI